MALMQVHSLMIITAKDKYTIIDFIESDKKKDKIQTRFDENPVKANQARDDSVVAGT